MNKRTDVKEIDLQKAIWPITEIDGVLEIYLFGSRAYKTGSIRSDIDILVYAPDGIRSDDITEVMFLEDALDVFETIDKKNARSFTNDSRLNREDIVKTLDAVLLWSKERGFNEKELAQYNKQRVLIDHKFVKSTFDTNSEVQQKYYKKYGRNTVFIIMPFDDELKKVYNVIKKFVDAKGYQTLRADERTFSDDVWENVKVYLDCCEFGIAVFDYSLRQNFNPNVALEVGYLMALDKKVCLLKDKQLEKMPSDLVSKLYKEYDLNDLKKTITKSLENWFSDHSL